MSSGSSETPGFRIPRAVLAVAILALAYKLYLAWTTIGTNDVRAFWYFLQQYRGSGAVLLYEKESEFNHPPFVIRWLLALRWIHRTTGLPPWVCLRVPAILADFGSVLVVARLLGPRLALPSVRLGLLLVAAAPVSVMVSGFHGNNDPVMIFFVLLSILLLERGSPVWLAGLAMGMAVNMKVVPLVFWPAVFLWLPSWRRRFEYFGAATAAVVLASMPVLFQAPGLLAHKVLGYPSSYGIWGISRLPELTPALEGVSEVFEKSGRFLLAGLLVAISVWMNRGPAKPPLYRQIGTLAFAFLAVTPGFGVQYLAWLVPWIAAVAAGAAIAWTATSAAFLFLVYTFWNQGVPFEYGTPDFLAPEFFGQGLPWHFADANSLGPWRGPMVPFELACWVSVLLVLRLQLRAARDERGSPGN